MGRAGIPTPPKKQNIIQLKNDMNPITNITKETSIFNSASSLIVQVAVAVVLIEVELERDIVDIGQALVVTGM